MVVIGAQMNRQGRVVIPAAIPKMLDLEGPIDLLFRLEGGVLTVETVDDAVTSVQRLVSQHVDPARSLVDELIAERRAEAASE